MSNKAQTEEIHWALSPARIATYVAAAHCKSPDDPAALELYLWNAHLSAAFLTPLHLCEVILRNAVDDALGAKYGAAWPWSAAFEQSLPVTSMGYNPRGDLFKARQAFSVGQTGKVIAELKFVFWQRMFAARHDNRIWNPHLRRVLPHTDPNQSVAQTRKNIFDALDTIRHLRNRIAHHEPIFHRALDADWHMIGQLIAWRSPHTFRWLEQHQEITRWLAARPQAYAVSLY